MIMTAASRWLGRFDFRNILYSLHSSEVTPTHATENVSYVSKSNQTCSKRKCLFPRHINMGQSTKKAAGICNRTEFGVAVQFYVGINFLDGGMKAVSQITPVCLLCFQRFDPGIPTDPT